ncbi:MAG: class I SAM-dependent DNA methyltransferase [Planctomycetota bacterium]
MIKLTKPYDVFSLFYDESYQSLRANPLRWLAPVLDEPLANSLTICDLACGTGLLASEMARLRKTVYAVDHHPGMLALARERARKLTLPGRRMRIVDCDIRRFDLKKLQLPEPVDLITCFFDSMNHLQHRGDLAKVFRSANAALRPGGWFVFDINTRKGVAHPWPDPPEIRIFNKNGKKYYLYASPIPFQQKTGNGGVRFEWFIQLSKDRFRHAVEMYREISWSDSEVERALRTAKFINIEKFDGSKLERNLGPGLRNYYRARKGDSPRS